MRLFKGWKCFKCMWDSKKYFDSCGGCGALNTLRQGKIIISQVISKKGEVIATQVENEVEAEEYQETDTTVSMDEVEELNYTCLPTEISSLDEVLGGGIFSSSAVLLGARAGTGKTTLCLQVADKYCSLRKRVLYLCGEEAGGKLKITAKRLKLKLPKSRFRFSFGSDMEEHISNIEIFDPELIICDSLDVMKTKNGTPGDLAQKKAVSKLLMDICHDEIKPRSSIAISHLNANGDLAGSEANKHLLDVYLRLDNEFGLVKCWCDGKNRNGRSDIVKYFEMTDRGLISIKPDLKLQKKKFDEERMEDN